MQEESLILTPDIAEFVGAVIGDGYVYTRKNHYVIGLVGHPETDKEYFTHLESLIRKEFGKETSAKYRFRGLRLVFSSKRIVQFLTNDLEMKFGAGKSGTVIIPRAISENEVFLKNTIRGIADTDGSVFTSRKPGVESYPAIEITTSSQNLATQLWQTLFRFGFRVPKIRSYRSKLSRQTTYKISLYGQKNLRKWLAEISFSNPTKRKRALAALR